MTEVGLFMPFKSDHWHSIERFSELLYQNLPIQFPNFNLTIVRPSERWKLMGETLGRRVIYTAASSFKKFDVYHIVDQSYSHIAHMMPAHKTVITCHDLEFWRRRQRKNSLLRIWIAQSMLKAQQIVVPSQMIKTEVLSLSADLGSLLPKIDIIANACGAEFKPTANLDVIKATWNLKERCVILNISNTHWPRKNFSFLLNLVQRLKVYLPEILMIQVGPRWLKEHSEFITQNSLQNNIRHLENISAKDIVELYQVADLYLQPSTYEGFGYPLLESIACSTPFLASEIPVFKELFPVKKGLLPLDIDLWESTVRRILSDSAEREQFVNQQMNLLSQYSWQNQVRSYAEVYSYVAKN